MLENNFINSQFANTLKLYYAQVIDSDTNESEKANAVKIKILGIMENFDDAHLPFAYPLTQFWGNTDNSGVSSSPLIDSFIWVTWIGGKFYYLFNANQVSSNLASKYFDEIQDQLGELENITAPDLEYPNAISFFYESGICVTYSTDSEKPIYSIFHPEGSYAIIDVDGSIGAYSVKNLEAHAEENIYITKKDGLNFYTEDKNIHLEDGNGNKTDWDDSGTLTEDANGNKITTDNTGMILEDMNANTTTMSSSGIKNEDLNGNTFEMGVGKISINGINLEVLT